MKNDLCLAMAVAALLCMAPAANAAVYEVNATGKDAAAAEGISRANALRQCLNTMISPEDAKKYAMELRPLFRKAGELTSIDVLESSPKGKLTAIRANVTVDEKALRKELMAIPAIAGSIKEVAAETADQAEANHNGSETSAQPQKNENEPQHAKTEDTPAPQAIDNGNNDIPWGSFYGVELPPPDGRSAVCERTAKEDSTTVRIDGLSWEEFVRYCKKLEQMPGWRVKNGESSSNLPAGPKTDDIVYFTGAYGNLPHINLRYNGDEYAKNAGVPNFSMFVFEKW
ncbi:MAG: hypothetical protein J6I40_04045 [Mailhella sp.]|nr:hypothetical protein [Mailhella sp.]